MSTIDIREIEPSVINKIRFAQDTHHQTGSDQASAIEQSSDGGQIFICEGDSGDSVRINGLQHAKDMVKALEKAIELGWLD